METTSVISTKGGVGKTVTTVHLGGGLADAGKRVLMIDIDLQHGLSSYYGADISGVTTEQVLLDGSEIAGGVLEVAPNLFLLPATARIGEADVQLASASGGEVRLRRAMRKLGNAFDHVLIDCPGYWGACSRNALLASNLFIIPINSEAQALAPAIATEDAARELAEMHDHDLRLLGVLLTRYRPTKTAKAVEAFTQKQWGDEVFCTRIRQTEKVNDLAAMQKSANDVAAGLSGAAGEDYAQLAREFTERLK